MTTDGPSSARGVTIGAPSRSPKTAVMQALVDGAGGSD